MRFYLKNQYSYFASSVLLHFWAVGVGLLLVSRIHFQPSAHSSSHSQNRTSSLLFQIQSLTPSTTPKKKITHRPSSKSQTSSTQPTETKTFPVPSSTTETAMGSKNRDSPSAGSLMVIRNLIEEHLEYPLALRRRGIEGKVLIRIRWDKAGRLELNEVIKTSGHDRLDRLAQEAADRAAPFPVLANPENFKKLAVIIPIEFRTN